MSTPRDDARQLAQRQRAGSDWFSHDSPRADSRCETPRSGRGTGAFSKKYSGESDKWYSYDKSPTKEAAAAVPDEQAGGDTDATVAPHDKAFVEEPTQAAPVEPAPEPAPAAEPEPAPEPAAAEPVPKLDIESSDSEPSSPEKKPTEDQTKTAKGEATAHKERGHNMSEDWYHYSESQIGKREENGPVAYNYDIQGLKSETSSQAKGYKNRNKGSASDWYKHGTGAGEAAPADSTPKKEQPSPTRKKEIDLSSKDKVREYAAQAKAGSAGDWFGHSGGEYTPRRQGKPRVTDEGQSFAERNKGSFSIFNQESPATEPVRTSRGAAPRGCDSMGGLLRMEPK